MLLILPSTVLLVRVRSGETVSPDQYFRQFGGTTVMQNLCLELFAERWDGAFRSLLTCDFHRAYANRDPERLAVMRPAN